MKNKIPYEVTFLRPIEQDDLGFERLGIGTLVPIKECMLLDPNLDLTEQIESKNKRNLQLKEYKTLDVVKQEQATLDNIINGN